MPDTYTGPGLSPLRARLASFEHAYAVAIQLKRATGYDHYVVACGSDFQPFRTTPDRPLQPDSMVAHVA